MPTPNFEDAPDGSSSINHTGESCPSLYDDDMWDNIDFSPPAPPSPNPVGYSSEFPPHPSYADGSAPLMPPAVNATHNTAIGSSAMAHNTSGTQNAVYPVAGAHTSRQSPRRNRRGVSDPDAAMRKDPNAWSMREAVELCKLLEVVVPEAGFHIALTGGLLYKEGRRKDCDLMFYQIRQMEPNYEVLWKYLTVAGVLRSPSYPENGWLVKATYRGKVVDCLFPNAKKVKKVVGKEPAPNQNAYQTSPPTPPTPAPPTIRGGYVINSAWEAASPFIDPRPYETINVGPPPTSAPVIPILYRRSPDAPGPYDPAELLSTPAPRPTRYDSTREATAHELEATEVYLRERRGLREPEIRSNAEIIDAALLATPAPAPIPAVEQWEEIF